MKFLAIFLAFALGACAAVESVGMNLLKTLNDYPFVAGEYDGPPEEAKADEGGE